MGWGEGLVNILMLNGNTHDFMVNLLLLKQNNIIYLQYVSLLLRLVYDSLGVSDNSYCRWLGRANPVIIPIVLSVR